MGNVGNKLEEARKRQGITIREASEATKIRTEYLSNFENDNFDFDLPDVYKRGFVKMYARLLKIDVDRFMVDVDSLMQGRGKSKSGREFFGRMDLPSAGGGSSSLDSSPSSVFNEGDSGVGVAFKKGGSQSVPAAERLELGTDKTLYWKIGLVCVGTIVVVGLIALLIQTILSSSTPAAPTTQGGSQTVAQVTIPTVTIIAKGDVRVAARETSGAERVLIQSENLRTGERRTIHPEGDFSIIGSNIQNVEVEVNGRAFNSTATGLGRFSFDATGRPL